MKITERLSVKIFIFIDKRTFILFIHLTKNKKTLQKRTQTKAEATTKGVLKSLLIVKRV